MLLTLNKDRGVLVSEILQLSAVKRKNISQRKKLEKAIEALGSDFFITICIQILEFAYNFKNKTKYRVSYGIKGRDYFGMFNENLLIVYGLIQTLDTKKLIERIPIVTLTIIAKRSYSLKQEIRLSKRSTKVGHLCVKILAFNYGEQSDKELKEIYEEIPYERVKRAIDKVLKIDND